jgi:competence protein ComEC
MRVSISCCKSILAWGLCAVLACSPLLPKEGSDEFAFTVVDVGQGLSQVARRQGQTVVWDLGPPEAAARWRAWYTAAGSPPIAAIVISHRDLDHRGGLRELPESLDFSGLVITSVFEDTALMRAEAGCWATRLRFRTIHQGDTLAFLPEVTIECLWPPVDPADELTRDSTLAVNRLSVCCALRYRTTSALITSDIDSIAARGIYRRYGIALHSEILVLPHHGSRGSLEPVFYGYASPSVAIISCGRDNAYGHPAQEVVKFLSMQLGVTLFDTRYAGTLTFRSNGEYWR